MSIASLAAKNFKVIYEERIPVGTEFSRLGSNEIVHVIAEADTFSRYSVVVTPLGHGSLHEGGGEVVVSVLSPYRSAYPMQRGGVVASTYVAEKLIPSPHHSPADLTALTLLVAHALGGEPILPEGVEA